MPHTVTMASETKDAAAAIREWMLSILSEKDWTPAAWARRAGVAATTVQRAVKPTYEFTTSSKTLAKLASAAGYSPPDLTEQVQKYEPKFLAVRFKAQAGNWFEVDDTAQTHDESERPVAPDPRYEQYNQWLERVEGDSMDRRIMPGSYAHVVDAVEMGYTPREGDLVVVERRRDGGHLRERTIKQVSLKSHNIELWPRSNNPRWREPVVLAGGFHHDETLEVEIVGLVIGAYLPLR